MCRELIYRICLIGVAGLALTGPARADLVGWWKLDEGTGTTASDSSGQGNHATFQGAPAWVPGNLGMALRFNGTSDYLAAPGSPSLDINGDKLSITAWINGTAWTGSARHIVRKVSDTSMGVTYFLRIQPDTVHGEVATANGSVVAQGTTVLPLNQWVHVALIYDGAQVNVYVNGKADATVNLTGPITLSTQELRIGRGDPGGYFQGMIDDIRVYNHALTAAELTKAMIGRDPALASKPSPAHGATDVPRDTDLAWTAGQFGGKHDVYLGTVFADVNTADRTNAKGVLASRGQDAVMYQPAAPLAYGQTYYWRIDEVNKTPDNIIFKGDAWTFTVEPYAYPVTPAAAAASSSQAGMGPAKTIDGSGLSGDLHDTTATAMWLSLGTQPNWIQYQFDKVYQLYQLLVWNSNQSIEASLGLGAKKVTIEYSVDGTTWTPLSGVPDFAQAPGTAGYAANTTVNFGGVLAKYVKLTINSSWSGQTVTGLSEVRFFYVPVQARAPQPTNGATKVSVDSGLSWRPGREAASHKVLFGTDPNAVAKGTVAAQAVLDHAYTPGSLNFGTKYYWRVDEVNAVTYPGDVWSFTTQNYAVVDDFESYNDKDNAVYDTWIDGMSNSSNGSTVGYLTSKAGTFCETTIIHGGKQSMPFEYNNIKTPFYSEAERTFDTPQDWTANGIDTLSLYFRGYPAGFTDNGNNAYTISAGGTDIGGAADQFRFVYKPLNGNGSITLKVDSIANTNASAKAGVMIRETLTAGSRNAFLAVTPGSGVLFQWRDITGGTTANSTTAGLKAPYWVRITRTGNVFKAERSADGKTWTQQGVDTTIPMTANVYIGIAVTSRNANQITTAQVSSVSTTATGAWQAPAIGATMPANDPAPLYVTVEDKAGKKKTVVHSNASATTVAAWTEWRVPLSDVSAGGVNLAAVKKLTLGVGDRTSPKAGGHGMLYVDDIGVGHP